MHTLIIIATYNERENIVPLVDQIIKMSNQFDVLVIDDNSPDGTAAAVKEKFGESRQVHLLERPRKMGLGTAYTEGFRYGLGHNYDAIMTMDADFSHNPQQIPAFLKTAETHEMVIGSRYIPGGATKNWSVFRKFISRTANLFAHMILSLKPRDCTSGYRLFHSEVLKQVDFEAIKAEGYSYLIEFLYRASGVGILIGETPIIFVDRIHGKSKISKREIVRAIQTILRLRFQSSPKSQSALVKA